MAKITQVTVTAQSRPGVLAKVARTLADAGVNITAICAAESTGRGKLRMVVSDPGRAKQALTDAKIRCGEEPALLLSVEDRPGSQAITRAYSFRGVEFEAACEHGQPRPEEAFLR